MDTSGLPEPLRARMAELDARSPEETVREFVGAYLADADSLDEVRADLLRLARSNTRSLHRNLAGLDAYLAAQHPEGALARLVAWDGNWVLDDPSDAGAAAFLRELAAMLRAVLAAAG